MDICATRAECIGNTASIKDFMEDDEGVYVCTAVVPRRLLNIGVTNVKFIGEDKTIVINITIMRYHLCLLD